MSGKSHFEKTVLLSIGHVAVVLAGFLIPVFLSRWLSLDEYGTYKQLMLLYMMAMAIGHFGMDNGLFYFVKNHPGKEGLLSLNVVLFDAAIGITLALAAVIFKDSLAAGFNNPALARYLPLLALYTVLSLPTQHFEHYLAVLDDIRQAVWLGIWYETLKALVLVGAFYFFDSLWLALLGLNALALLKLAWLLRFNLRRLPAFSRGEAARFLRAQIRFGLPQGATNLLSTLLKMDKVVISSLFSVRQFALYAVGCFEVPLIGSVSNTMTDLMSFDMVDAVRRRDGAEVKRLWHSTLRKVALFQVPIALFLFCFAEETIVLIFSDAYRESAGYFRVFLFILLLSGFVPDILFRVFARTSELFKLQVLAAAFTLLAVIGLAYLYGPMGALSGKLLADTVTLLFTSRRAAHLLQLPARDYLPWGEMSGITVVSALAGLICYLGVAPWQLSPFWALLAGGSSYVTLVFLAAAVTGLLKKDELEYLRAKVHLVLPLRLRA